jgi:hypothetical protein
MPKEEEEEIVEVSKFSGKTIIHKKEWNIIVRVICAFPSKSCRNELAKENSYLSMKHSRRIPTKLNTSSLITSQLKIFTGFQMTVSELLHDYILFQIVKVGNTTSPSQIHIIAMIDIFIFLFWSRFRP